MTIDFFLIFFNNVSIASSIVNSVSKNTRDHKIFILALNIPFFTLFLCSRFLISTLPELQILFQTQF